MIRQMMIKQRTTSQTKNLKDQDDEKNIDTRKDEESKDQDDETKNDKNK